MRITDLIGKPAVHADGTALGTVQDVRLVREGPYGEAAALRVDGVIVGKGGAAVRLGYASPDLTGPWLLTAVLGRRARHALFVPWSELTVEDERLLVHAVRDSLRHPREIGP
jgi:sporulation protein YlmC with PRC-barrel domain